MAVTRQPCVFISWKGDKGGNNKFLCFLCLIHTLISSFGIFDHYEPDTLTYSTTGNGIIRQIMVMGRKQRSNDRILIQGVIFSRIYLALLYYCDKREIGLCQKNSSEM